MKIFILLFFILLAFTPITSTAKRPVPTYVTPINSRSIEYSAPHSQIGCIEARDTSTKQLIWRRQIYTIKYNLDLERDVQDIHIYTIKLSDSSMFITNEHKSEYKLDLETLNIKLLKGSLIEQRN